MARPPVGWILDSGIVVRPDGAPRHAVARGEWTWRCPRCRAQLAGSMRECLRCNMKLVDPERLAELDAPLAGPDGFVDYDRARRLAAQRLSSS